MSVDTGLVPRSQILILYSFHYTMMESQDLQGKDIS